MKPSDMVVEIQAYGFDALDTRIYPLLTRENRRLCAMAPFTFTQKFSTWTETAVPANVGTPLVGAPTDIRAVVALGQPAENANAGNIVYLDRNLISKIYGYNSYLIVDVPRHYNVYGKNSSGGCNLYVYPYIAGDTIFALDYLALPPVLNASTTEAQMLLPDAYSQALMDRVCAQLARSDGDLDDAVKYENSAQATVMEMLNDFDANMDSPPPMIFTDSEDSWFG